MSVAAIRSHCALHWQYRDPPLVERGDEQPAGLTRPEFSAQEREDIDAHVGRQRLAEHRDARVEVLKRLRRRGHEFVDDRVLHLAVGVQPLDKRLTVPIEIRECAAQVRVALVQLVEIAIDPELTTGRRRLTQLGEQLPISVRERHDGLIADGHTAILTC